VRHCRPSCAHSHATDKANTRTHKRDVPCLAHELFFLLRQLSQSNLRLPSWFPEASIPSDLESTRQGPASLATTLACFPPSHLDVSESPSADRPPVFGTWFPALQHSISSQHFVVLFPSLVSSLPGPENWSQNYLFGSLIASSSPIMSGSETIQGVMQRATKAITARAATTSAPANSGSTSASSLLSTLAPVALYAFVYLLIFLFIR